MTCSNNFFWKKYLASFSFFALYLSLASFSFAQIQPGIGLDDLPLDSDPICTIPVVPSNPNGAGPIVNQEVLDFSLYDLDGNSSRLSEALELGKPVLLISGSLTCPVFRERIPEINEMASVYGDNLTIFIIYTVEAHPTTPSPYSGTVWLTLQNINENILHPQPTTYGERKNLVDTLMSNYQIDVPVLIDGPCNNWWLNYGTGANIAFLIDENGFVSAKHDWFNQLQLNMYCEVDALIPFFSGYCTNYEDMGTFTFELLADSIAYGVTSDVLAVQGTIFNNSSTDFVVLDIIKVETDLPGSWESALCAEICYSVNTDSIRVAIPPGGQQEFIFYFYTDDEVNSGSALVMMRNVFVANRLYQEFVGVTSTSASLSNLSLQEIVIYPNPTSNTFVIENFEAFSDNSEYIIIDNSGKVVHEGALEPIINLENQDSGAYQIIIFNEDGAVSKRIILL